MGTKGYYNLQTISESHFEHNLMIACSKAVGYN